MSPGAGPTYFTTQQVAKMLGVSTPSVVNWVKAGRLDAHRTPGGHRRISRTALYRFAAEHHYPLPDAMEPATPPSRAGGVLVVDSEPDFAALVLEMLAINDPGIPVWAAADLLSAGLIIGRHGPAVVVLDIAMAGIDPVAFSRRLRADAATQGTRLVGLTAGVDPPLARRARDAGFVLVKSKSDNLQELVADLQALLSPSP